MTLDVTSEFQEEKNKQINSPIFLYTIFDYDGEDTDLNFAEWGGNVEFDSVTYLAFPITHDQIGENSQGEIEAVRVTISNISRLIQSYLELYDFRGKKVRIRMVWLDDLEDSNNKLDFVYYVDSYTATQESVEFTLLPKVDILGFQLPKRIYARNYCQWRFKGSECGYDGEELTCNRTKQRCKELDNYERFGGFPSIPSQRIYVS